RCRCNACVALPGIDDSGHDGSGCNQLRHATGIRVHSARRDHGQVDTENGRSRLRVHAHTSSARTVPEICEYRERTAPQSRRLNGGPFAQPDDVAQRRSAQADTRAGCVCRHHGRSDRRRKDWSGHRAPVDGVGNRRPFRPDRRVRSRLRLHLHEHTFLAHADDAASNGDQSSKSFRTHVRPGFKRDRTSGSEAGGPKHSRCIRAAGNESSEEPGPRDKNTMNDYLESVREIERRIQRTEKEQTDPDATVPPSPAGIPYSYEEHIKLMYDLLVLAFQANITRVITFMVAREISNRTYPQVGVPDGHHAISHHQNRAEKMEKNVKIQTYHIGLFAQFLEKLRSTRDGDGSLLDHSVLLYGSNMSNSNAHNHFPLPNLVLGGASGRLTGNRHLKYPDHTPMTNLLLSVLDKAGVDLETLGDSTGKMTDL